MWRHIELSHAHIIFTKHLNVEHVLLGPEYQETDTDREFIWSIQSYPFTLIQTVDSSKFYGIYSNTFLFFSSSLFRPQSSEACRSLIMHNILLPCFMETPDWIRSSHRLESLKTSSDKNINVPAVSYLFQLMHIQCPPSSPRFMSDFAGV